MLKTLTFAATLFLAGCARLHAAPLQTFTVCDLTKAGQTANGSRVHFHVILVTDLFESSALIDLGCPGAHLTYRISKEAIERNKLFVKALYGQNIDNNIRKFDIWGSGRFRWESSEKPPGVIDIERISRFRQLRK